MSQMFDKIKVSSNKRSTFDLSHHQITTSDFGCLLPICVREMVPNDDFVVTPKMFCRLMPMVAPTYGNIKCRVHHFFVPNRILYPHWDAFIEQDSSNVTIPPYFTVQALKNAINGDQAYNDQAPNRPGYFTRVMSNLGINPNMILHLPNDQRISALPFIAYYRIWLDWFMDSSIYDHPSYSALLNEIIADGGNLDERGVIFQIIRNACYKKDYFTTAKVNPQSGNASMVCVDLAGSDLNPGLHVSSGSNLASNGSVVYQNVAGASSIGTSKIGQFTVEALRVANSLQRYLERHNFVGTKIINRILADFGIAPTPERLDMAEFIGGSSFNIEIGDVTSTAFSQGTETYNFGLGEQAGKGVGAHHGDTVRYHAKEHGIFMSVLSILPDTEYFQGLHKMWTRGVTGDALDFFNEAFENLGFQPVLNKELYVPTHDNYSNFDPDGVFGYQPQYSDYKHTMSVLGGDFVNRFNGTGDQDLERTPLDSWHLFRKLYYTNSSPLSLNENFVELNKYNTDYDRIFQVTNSDVDHFYFNIKIDIKATRPMDGFAAPALEATNEVDGRQINLPYGGTRL